MKKSSPRGSTPSAKKPSTDVTRDSATELTQAERRVAKERTALRAAVIHEAIRAEGAGELQRPATALSWSGLAAGLSIGFSFVTSGLLRAHLADTNWRPLVTSFGYSVGFLAVILGRQQLYTENTLTVILPLLTLRDLATLTNVLRLWSIVLLANLVGACAFAWALASFNIFTPEVNSVFAEIAKAAISVGWSTLLVRGIVAGWLIALMVWMMPGADSSRAFIITVMTYVVALGNFPHGIAGSVDGFFLVARGALSWGSMLGSYLAPVLIGNTIGGVSLVAFFNHAQVVTEDSL
ncbi:MAG TPA: formate/nitrite transporter family protein [Candidatus Binataceae bacterium]|nr:formate/nitrite transporter family protein [Candidatus Binataceae bacterium]